MKEGSQGKEKKPYSLNDLNQEQYLIAYVALQKLKEWFDLGNWPEKEKSQVQTTANDSNGPGRDRKNHAHQHIDYYSSKHDQNQ